MQWGWKSAGVCLVLILAPQVSVAPHSYFLGLLPPPPVSPILLCIPESSPQTPSDLTDPTSSLLDHPVSKLSPLSFSWFLTKVETAQAQPPNRDAQLPPRGVQIDCSAEKSL